MGGSGESLAILLVNLNECHRESEGRGIRKMLEKESRRQSWRARKIKTVETGEALDFWDGK